MFVLYNVCVVYMCILKKFNDYFSISLNLNLKFVSVKNDNKINRTEEKETIFIVIQEPIENDAIKIVTIKQCRFIIVVFKVMILEHFLSICMFMYDCVGC